jgi:hypothetical protein
MHNFFWSVEKHFNVGLPKFFFHEISFSGFSFLAV